VLLKRAVFLDRDGVINEKMPEGKYVLSGRDFHFLSDVLDALRVLKNEGFLVIVITNQRCIGKKLITETALNRIHQHMIHTIRNHGGDIDAIYLCPHEISESCSCRKPQPGMILHAMHDFICKGIKIAMKDSYMVGDADSDILAGRAAGLKTIKIGTASTNADFTTESLYEAVRIITSNGEKSRPICLENMCQKNEELTK
jgi:D-glycero-D-manno-heptose 1,7-bisphosphate phosphatase